MIVSKLERIFFIILLFQINICQAQVWSLRAMIRFGNTVYHDIDSLSEEQLTGISTAFDDQIINRYFDFLSAYESIGLLVDNSIIYFSQKGRPKPECYKSLLFYTRRKLISIDNRIVYMKLKGMDSEYISATAKIKKRNGLHFAKEINIKIPKRQLEGLFLGPGKNQRVILSSLGATAVLMGLIIY